MSKEGKRLKAARALVDNTKTYPIAEAVQLVQQTAGVKFDAAVELHARLGIDPKKSDQLIRGSVSLPHGTGQKKKVAAFVGPADQAAAKAAGASLVGGEELIKQIKETGKCDFDVAVATPELMKQMGPIAKTLGQKGLMPNPKTGTVTPDPAKVISELLKGKVNFKNDDTANLHQVVGRVSFSEQQLTENIQALLTALKELKPGSLKGTFLRGVFLTSSMGPSVRLAV